jgi:DNA-nicking Smr family endonuclease
VSAKKKAKKPAGPFEALRALKEDLKKREEAATERKASPAPAPKPSPARPASRAAADEDDALVLHRLFAGVEPLDRSRGRLPKQSIVRSPAIEELSKKAEEAAQLDAEAVHEHLRSLVEGRARFEVEDDGSRVAGRRVDVPFDAMRRLRRGLLPIDARIDLHGSRAREARVELEVFLRTMRARGERCVLVIHGKGEHSPDGAGVLRGEIAAWLSQSAASEHVAAFATAAGGDGGEGAVYVLLRR